MLTTWRATAALAAVIGGGLAGAGFCSSALAAPTRSPIEVTPDLRGGIVGVIVTAPGGAGTGGNGRNHGRRGVVGHIAVPVVSPRCTEPSWKFCLPLPQGAPIAGPTAERLAQQAYGLLRLPTPTGDRSPQEDLRWRGHPFTYVNLWTWFWTSPETYRLFSKTVRAGALSATVTASPTALVFDPGDGNASVACAGPGRPWLESDEAAAPPTGCGYRYGQVTSPGPVTATVSIHWQVTWAGSNGESGTLPVLVTERPAELNVLQVQVVNAAAARP